MASLTLIAVALTAVSSQPKLLDFYSQHCGPCRQMAPVIAELERRGHAVEKIDVDQQPQLAAQYRVESIPCLVVVIDGREVDRTLGVTPLTKLETMLRTAAKAPTGGASPGGAAPLPQTATAVAPAAQRGPVRDALGAVMPGRRPPNPARSVRGRQPMGATGTPRLARGEQVQPQGEPNEPFQAEVLAAQGPTANQAAQSAPPSGELPQLVGIQSEQPLPAQMAAAELAATASPAGEAAGWKSSTVGALTESQPQPAPAAGGDRPLPDKLLAASVRLRIEEPGGSSSKGSGTIIDVRGEDALILTCGHVFRESQGKGTVLVDMFGPGAPQGLTGEVICYDLATDVGLVSFRPGVPATVTRLAAPGTRPQPGDAVFNTGCNNGDDPTLRSSRITTVDKYLGAPNLQVAGQPVQGRSGGGLFNVNGEVIGVCNAADPADNEGLYAALPNVYQLLDNAGLSDLYRPATSALVGGAAPASNLNPLPPHMPEQMPLAVTATGATETSAPQATAPAGGVPGSRMIVPDDPAYPLAAAPPAGLADPALLAAQQANPAAEIVCIVRQPGKPQTPSDLIVLDRATPELLQHLAQERQRQSMAGAPAGLPLAAPQTLPANPLAQQGVPLEARQLDPRAPAMR